MTSERQADQRGFGVFVGVLQTVWLVGVGEYAAGGEVMQPRGIRCKGCDATREIAISFGS